MKKSLKDNEHISVGFSNIEQKANSNIKSKQTSNNVNCSNATIVNQNSEFD